MKTHRDAYKLHENNPRSDLAVETPAAFAAASMAFHESDPMYYEELLNHAKMVGILIL